MENWDRLKVTENNALQLLTDYIVWKYGETEIMKMRDECTFELDFMDDPDKVYKQIVLWLTFERRDPKTGKLAVEEFVEKFVTDNNDIAKRMMGWRNITKDTFLILGNKDDIVFLEDSNKRKFNVQVFPKQVAALYTFGRYVEGRIYPWGKGDLYRFASISKLMKSDEERMMDMGLITPDAVMDWYEKKFKEDAESIIISTRNSSLQSILNKLPSEWINAICVNLGLKKTGKKVEKVKKITTLLLSNRVRRHYWDTAKELPSSS